MTRAGSLFPLRWAGPHRVDPLVSGHIDGQTDENILRQNSHNSHVIRIGTRLIRYETLQHYFNSFSHFNHLAWPTPFAVSPEYRLPKESSRSNDFRITYDFSPKRLVAFPPARTPDATQAIIPPPSVPAPTKNSPSIPAVKELNRPGPT